MSDTELYFIGIGSSGLRGCTIETLDILTQLDEVFIEKYTNYVPGEIPPLLNQIKSNITILNREDIENNDHLFLERIKGKSAAILISGDPFIATTHNSLRIEAVKQGIKCRIIHNSSILTAAASVSGLSAYRFGRTVTCPFPRNASEFPYKIIKLNEQIGAHTLVLLDIDTRTGEFLSINEAISILLGLEEKNQETVFTKTSLVIGLAQIGTDNEFILPGNADEVKTVAWRDIGPPQALIVCSEPLHFIEEEALQTLWNIDLSSRKKAIKF
ncbi:MAG: diphthine synthase [Candidatus Heimdallarchaeota archaeon]|nr:MAG: diphthine synthase [Candidatus Heimdallarchaeota archaeon]